MFSRSLLSVWFGIVVLSGMFLLGQDTWPPPPECTGHEDCDDGNPCTDEYCLVDGTCLFIDKAGLCDDGNSCTLDDVCDQGVCSGIALDADGDGYGPDSCGGDCDDGNPDVYPAAPELCDEIDDQCPGDPGYGEVDEGCDMAEIPAGCFDMGDHFGVEGWWDELPVHNVCISAFGMDRNEVTNAKYEQCVDAGACTDPASSSSVTRPSYYGNPTYDDFPVIQVDWVQAKDYCTWAGKRLPTEAEWEYAARGGLAGKRYPWGDTIGGEDANYLDSGDPWDNDTSPVGTYAANGYGLHDMAGDVWEWVNDWYQVDYYTVSPTNDPTGPASGTYRVLRGGSWVAPTNLLRVSTRFPYDPVNVHDIWVFGFRCAR